jgi:hypothetical protein
VISSSAVRKEVNSPIVMPAAEHVADRDVHHPASPIAETICTTGWRARARMSFMFWRAVVLDDLLELRRLVRLRVEHLDQPLALDRLLGDARDVAHRVLDPARVAAERAIDPLDQPADHGAAIKRERGQPPVAVEEPREQPDDRQRVLDQDRDDGRRGLGDQFGVVRQARQQLAGLAAVVERDRQVQVVRNSSARSLLDDLPTDPAGTVRAQVVADPAEQEQQTMPTGTSTSVSGSRSTKVPSRKPSPATRSRCRSAPNSAMPRTPTSEHRPVRPRVARAASVDRPGIARRRGRRGGRSWRRARPTGRPRAQVPGCSFTVAMFTCEKPRRPATSIAVTTAWWLARASARIVTGWPFASGATFSSAARSVAGRVVDQRTVVHAVAAVRPDDDQTGSAGRRSGCALDCGSWTAAGRPG